MRRILGGVLAVASGAAVCLSALLLLDVFAPRRDGRREAIETVEPPPPTVEAPLIDSWKAAARKVEEDRGEPVGRRARVDVPLELRHYDDRRRFLAVQVAESVRQDYDIPHDYAELIELIRRDQLVEMKPVGAEYVLYGVGASASGEALTHYDVKGRADIPLYDGYADFEDAYADRTASLERLRAGIPGLQAQLRKTPRRDRRRRRALQADVRAARASAAALDARRKLLASYYKDYDKRRLLVGEYRLILDTAADFDGRSYDLRRPEERRQFQARLLSFIRPEARDVLLEIARAYHRRFQRPLPVTSLVRTERYQRELGQTNPNATRIPTPPHTTGLAFDIYYRYMTGVEQDHLMDEIAGLEQEGRVEALRENRDHIHVFAFAEGERPAESLIARSLRDIAPGTTRAARKLEARPAARRPAAARPALRRGGSSARPPAPRSKPRLGRPAPPASRRAPR